MAMTPDEQQTRTEPGGALPGVQPVAGPGTEIGLTIPEDALILITTRNLVLFPGTVLPMTLGRQRSVLAAQTAVRLSRPVGLILQREAEMDSPMAV
ncbi:MAG: LON peptidase substrate-binding domain-containing protein, partial [Alphaproteobacteria bacterium]